MDGKEALPDEMDNLQALEKDFQEVTELQNGNCFLFIVISVISMVQVLEELMGEESLEKFRGEYDKLHHALKKSQDSEKRLMNKCRELNSEIVANAAKVTTALKLSQDDKSTISSLKQVFKKNHL